MTRDVRVVDYDPAWATQAAAEIQRLRAALGGAALLIEHVGSTSVPGLAAKPTLDFMVVVGDLAEIEARTPVLAALGYEARGEQGIPGRRYFRIRAGEAHTHHLHTYAAGHPEIARHLDFRNYLRAHPEAAAAYGELKRHLAARYPRDMESYTEAKTPFIECVLRRAAEGDSAA